MLIIAIDPGKFGAIVTLNTITDEKTSFEFPLSGKLVEWHSVYAYAHKLSNMQTKRIVVIEKVGARPGQSGVSMFTFGHNVGMLQGFMTALGMPIKWVAPNVWAKFMHEGIKSDLGTKEKSIIAALNLWPQGRDFFRGSRPKAFHDGIVDAYLIAEYYRRKGLGVITDAG